MADEIAEVLENRFAKIGYVHVHDNCDPFFSEIFKRFVNLLFQKLHISETIIICICYKFQ